MKKPRILFSCIGGADRKGAEQGFPEHNPGPIVRTLRQSGVDLKYPKIILFSDNKTLDSSFAQALKNFCKQQLEYSTEVISTYHEVNAMDRSALYLLMKQLVEQYSPHKEQRTYLLSSGTAAMHLCWTLLAHTDRYHARLIDVSREQGVVEVPYWIELAHAFLPILPKQSNQFMAKLGAEIEHADILGKTPKLLQAKGLASQVGKASREDYSVLIFGETGTGKESMARLIHRESKPPETARFLAINCGAINENLLESELFGHKKGAFTNASSDKKGLFESAGVGGTVFLDEIGEMPQALQIKLLRVLQERTICPVGDTTEIKINDIRIIAATHKSLAKGVSEGWFREDLYYRLNVIEIYLPPLRERPEDLKELCENCLGNINASFIETDLVPVTLSDDAYQPLREHPWYGNIRELQNTLRRAALFAQQSSPPVINAELLRSLVLSPINNNKTKDWGNRALEGFDIENLFDEIRHHYYLRIKHESTRISREDHAKSMGISMPTLREKEDSWEIRGWKVFPRQKRSKKEAKNENSVD